MALVRPDKDRAPRWMKDAANVSTRGYGMVTAWARPLPDFLVVGTKRGGTTSLWNYLAAHPGVLPMFPGVRGRKSTDWFFADCARSEAWYRSHFHSRAHRARVERRLGHAPVTGEASPYYMYDPRIAEKVRRVVPEVKVLMTLRDPVHRALSHYKERVGQGVEHLSFTDALAAEPGRTAGELERMLAEPGYHSTAHDWYSYRARGVYEPQVRRWLDLFGPDQVLVLPAERLYRDRQAALDEVSDFLGIGRRDVTGFGHHNRTPSVEIDPSVRRELTDFYRPHNEALYALIGRDLAWER